MIRVNLLGSQRRVFVLDNDDQSGIAPGIAVHALLIDPGRLRSDSADGGETPNVNIQLRNANGEAMAVFKGKPPPLGAVVTISVDEVVKYRGQLVGIDFTDNCTLRVIS